MAENLTQHLLEPIKGEESSRTCDAGLWRAAGTRPFRFHPHRSRGERGAGPRSNPFPALKPPWDLLRECEYQEFIFFLSFFLMSGQYDLLEML